MDYGTLGDSECSSGCESGWTLYLENSYMAPPYHSCGGNRFLEGKGGFSQENGYEEEEEEDLSMVSDASSGPPQFVEEEDYGNDNNGCSYHAAPVNSAAALPVKRQKKKENRRRSIREHPSALDDTASSPIFNLSNNNFTINNQASVENVVLDFSQGYSTTHLQGRSVYQEQYGFFLPSLLPENQLLVQNQWYEGKKWG